MDEDEFENIINDKALQEYISEASDLTKTVDKRTLEKLNNKYIEKLQEVSRINQDLNLQNQLNMVTLELNKSEIGKLKKEKIESEDKNMLMELDIKDLKKEIEILKSIIIQNNNYASEIYNDNAALMLRNTMLSETVVQKELENIKLKELLKTQTEEKTKSDNIISTITKILS